MIRIARMPTSIAVGALFCAVTHANAAFETETPAPVTFGTSPFPEMLTLPEFDSSLGTLTGASITVTTTTTLEADVANFGQATSFTGATATGTTTLSGLLGLTYSKTLSTTPYNGSIGDGSSSPVIIHGTPPTFTTAADTMTISSANFGAYEYSGAAQNMPFDVDFLATYTGSGPAGSAPGLFFGGEANVSGMVSVTYTYDVPVVPEAATVWAGLGALACCCLGVRSSLRNFLA